MHLQMIPYSDDTDEVWWQFIHHLHITTDICNQTHRIAQSKKHFHHLKQKCCQFKKGIEHVAAVLAHSLMPMLKYWLTGILPTESCRMTIMYKQIMVLTSNVLKGRSEVFLLTVHIITQQHRSLKNLKVEQKYNWPKLQQAQENLP